MAVKVVVPPQFTATKVNPAGKPDGHQTSPIVAVGKLTMTEWIRRDQEAKESQPQPQYS